MIKSIRMYHLITHTCDSGQEKQDSLQHPVSHNNINVSLAERQTVSGDRTDEETEYPGFMTTKASYTILLQTISVPLTTKSGEVEDFNILLDSGSDRSFILNSVLDKLETRHIAIGKMTYGSFCSSNVTQSGLRNLHEVNLSSSVQVQCLGVEAISSKIFKPKLSSDVIQELTQLNVSYSNAGEGIEIHMLIGLNHYWDIIQPDFIRLSCGFVAQNSKLGFIISGACFNNDSTSNMSNATPSVLCCIASSPPTAGNGGSCKDIQDFWSLKSIGIDTPISIMTGSVENDPPAFFTELVQYKNERYSVALPWRDSEAKNKLLNNYNSAALRFANLKRRLARDEEPPTNITLYS